MGVKSAHYVLRHVALATIRAKMSELETLDDGRLAGLLENVLDAFSNEFECRMNFKVVRSLDDQPHGGRIYEGEVGEEQDLHRSNAALIFDVPYRDVTDEQRREAKRRAYRVMYGR